MKKCKKCKKRLNIKCKRSLNKCKSKCHKTNLNVCLFVERLLLFYIAKIIF